MGEDVAYKEPSKKSHSVIYLILQDAGNGERFYII